MAGQTEGGGIKGRVRPAVGINTDVDGLERLRAMMAKAKSAESTGAAFGHNIKQFVGSSAGDDVDVKEWMPYGMPVGAGVAARQVSTCVSCPLCHSTHARFRLTLWITRRFASVGVCSHIALLL
jgi:hypothetical protein